MPTIADLIVRAEEERAVAQRRADDADHEMRRVRERAERDGRDRLTDAEDAEVTRLYRDRRDARDEVTRCDARLTALREAQSDETAAQARMNDTRPNANTTGRNAPHPVEVRERGADPGSAATGAGPMWRRAHDGRPAAVARGESFRDHEITRELVQQSAGRDAAVIGQHGSLGQLVRSMSTTTGSALVPTVWASEIIDRARNYAAVHQAGATTIPMDAKIVQIGRLTADPSAAFRSEGSTITASDPSFDSVTLSATTLSTLVIGSIEWFQDAPNSDEIVSNAIARAIALEIDRQALFGGLTTGSEVGATGFNTTFPTPPNPRGVLANLLANAASSVLGGAANGTNITAATPYNELLDTIFTPTDFNEVPNAVLWPSKMARFMAKRYDTTNQPMRMPPQFEAMPRFTTNQIPSNLTVGTSTANMTDVFAGDWTQLLVGQRLDLQVQTLTERYAELGQVGIIATWRGDIQLARPRAFCVYRYLQNA